ncbi:hypothetical protein JCM8097_004695 [Rhodosporidiobolus ruineniae]
MSQSTAGPCLVCGEETTSRCEACRQAGIDLFFCSKEHQKLLWPVHKKVCGPGKASPFMWPDLSQVENEAAKRLLRVEQLRGSKDWHLSLEYMLRGMNCCPEKYETLLDDLTEHGTTTLPVANKHDTLVLIRTALASAAEPFDGTNPTGIDLVLTYLSTVAIECLSPRADYPSQPPVWHSHLHHLLLSAHYLSFLYSLSPSTTPPEVKAHLLVCKTASCRRLVEYVRAEVPSQAVLGAEQSLFAVLQESTWLHAPMPSDD